MPTCCRGRNAGKPISRFKYLFGLVFFVVYHLLIMVSLALRRKKYGPALQFQWVLFKDHFRGVLKREDIVVETGQEVKCGEGEDGL